MTYIIECVRVKYSNQTWYSFWKCLHWNFQFNSNCLEVFLNKSDEFPPEWNYCTYENHRKTHIPSYNYFILQLKYKNLNIISKLSQKNKLIADLLLSSVVSICSCRLAIIVSFLKMVQGIYSMYFSLTEIKMHVIILFKVKYTTIAIRSEIFLHGTIFLPLSVQWCLYFIIIYWIYWIPSLSF